MSAPNYLDIAIKGADRLRPETNPERELYDEQQRDHALAASRGQRLSNIANRVADTLFADGQINNITEFRAALIPALAEEMFAGLAVDMPRLR